MVAYIDRYFGLIVAVFALFNMLFFIHIGAGVALLLIWGINFFIGLGFQLEHEVRQGVLS